MKPPAKTVDEVIKAINGSGGIKTVIASRLGVVRSTVDAYLNRWKAAREAYDSEVETTKDFAESVIVGNIRIAAKQAASGEAADSSDAWKYLSFKARERGYVVKKEIEHSGQIDVRSLTDEELEAIARGGDL
jgi:hypothetical protein